MTSVATRRVPDPGMMGYGSDGLRPGGLHPSTAGSGIEMWMGAAQRNPSFPIEVLSLRAPVPAGFFPRRPLAA
jgi:hypothetical protein